MDVTFKKNLTVPHGVNPDGGEQTFTYKKGSTYGVSPSTARDLAKTGAIDLPENQVVIKKKVEKPKATKPEVIKKPSNKKGELVN